MWASYQWLHIATRIEVASRPYVRRRQKVNRTLRPLPRV